MAALSSTLCPLPRSKPRTVKDTPDGADEELLDDALIELAKKGDGDAFSRLMERHNRFCLSKAYSILKNRGDAEDDAQTSWMQAWKHLRSYRGQGSFRAWLGRIVSNECLMRLRRARLATLTSVDEVFNFEGLYRLEVIDQRDLPEETVGEGEVSLVLTKEIRGIPHMLREVLLMRDVHYRDMRDIARYLGITVPAAKSRLLRARLELRHRLVKHMGTNGCGAVLRKGGRRCAAYVSAGGS